MPTEQTRQTQLAGANPVEWRAAVTHGANSGLTPAARLRELRTPNSALRTLWLIPFLLAGLCFWQALPGARSASQPTATASVLPGAPATRRTLVTRPIQDIRPGMRVLAENPELKGQDIPQIEIDPENTRLVSLHMVKPDGHELTVDTLMELDWLYCAAIDRLESDTIGRIQPLPMVGSEDDVLLNELLIGHVVELNLAELGAEGPATITSIHSCPPIEPDDGTGRRLVTSVFRHAAANVIDITVSGSDQSIGVTANHPFWSEDRQSFVPAGELRTGENLHKADGTLTQITRITPRRGPPVPVFNFEVDGQHVYSVGVNGLLVHNACVYQSIVGKAYEYIGVTGNFERRAAEHLRNGRFVEIILDNITRKQARAIEHLLIEKLGRARLGTGTLSNWNGGIDPRKLKDYKDEIAWARDMIAKLGF